MTHPTEAQLAEYRGKIQVIYNALEHFQQVFATIATELETAAKTGDHDTAAFLGGLVGALDNADVALFRAMEYTDSFVARSILGE